MASSVLRVFVVDDSSLYRKIICDAVSSIDGVRLSGFARDGREALEKIAVLQPDVVTLDVEMPEMNGIETLAIINERWPNIRVVMVSSTSEFSVKQTILAVEGCAFSFITKPENGDIARINRELATVFEAISAERGGYVATSVQPVRTVQTKTVEVTRTPLVCVIGISTGGPNALVRIIPTLPANLKVPVCIVQHMPAGFTKALADSLCGRSSVVVKEAIHGELLKPGCVYIAMGGKQMRLAPSTESPFGKIEITDDAPENFCKPSVDYLLRSCSLAFPGRVITIIMTGMGSDGTRGLQLVKRHGGTAIGQDEKSCTVYGMPGSAMRAGVIDVEVPLDEIVPTLLKYL